MQWSPERWKSDPSYRDEYRAHLRIQSADRRVAERKIEPEPEPEPMTQTQFNDWFDLRFNQAMAPIFKALAENVKDDERLFDEIEARFARDNRIFRKLLDAMNLPHDMIDNSTPNEPEDT